MPSAFSRTAAKFASTGSEVAVSVPSTSVAETMIAPSVGRIATSGVKRSSLRSSEPVRIGTVVVPSPAKVASSVPSAFSRATPTRRAMGSADASGTPNRPTTTILPSAWTASDEARPTSVSPSMSKPTKPR